jgi:hypothetical protein
MAAEDDDPFRAETPCRDHTAETHGAVADDGDRLPEADACGECRVMAGRHHVRQRQQGRRQRVVRADRQDDEGPVRLRHANGRLRLGALVPMRTTTSFIIRPVTSFAAANGRGLPAKLAKQSCYPFRQRRRVPCRDSSPADFRIER